MSSWTLQTVQVKFSLRFLGLINYFIHSFIGWVLIALASLELTMFAILALNLLEFSNIWSESDGISDTHYHAPPYTWLHVCSCTCVFMYMCVRMCVHVHVCALVCGVTGGSLVSSSITLHISFLSQGLSWIQSSQIWQEWLASKPPNVPIPPVLGLQVYTAILK